MMVEFEDRNEDDQRRFLDYLNRLKTQPAPTPCSACLGRGCDLCSHTGWAEYMLGQAPSPERWLWRLLGRLYLVWLRWRYRRS